MDACEIRRIKKDVKVKVKIESSTNCLLSRLSSSLKLNLDNDDNDNDDNDDDNDDDDDDDVDDVDDDGDEEEKNIAAASCSTSRAEESGSEWDQVNVAVRAGHNDDDLVLAKSLNG
uniref:Uncharacterized protein n=1 Tax=Vespula pensylvanica TaxID=30213 RepID=A0A834JRK7_VESPE|nr:hypothetical protein H0235_017305 [Vespula pensylvanica]